MDKTASMAFQNTPSIPNVSRISEIDSCENVEVARHGNESTVICKTLLRTDWSFTRFGSSRPETLLRNQD